jgi:hypothetical protein
MYYFSGAKVSKKAYWVKCLPFSCMQRKDKSCIHT